MTEFQVVLRSFQQVLQFVSVAADQPFDIRVGNDWQHINGKDFMGMFSLDYTRPVTVRSACTGELAEQFRTKLASFVVS